MLQLPCGVGVLRLEGTLWRLLGRAPRRPRWPRSTDQRLQWSPLRYVRSWSNLA